MPSILTPGQSYAMTNAQRLALSLDHASAGAFVITTDTKEVWRWTGSDWVQVPFAGAASAIGNVPFPVGPNWSLLVADSAQVSGMRWSNYVDGGTY